MLNIKNEDSPKILFNAIFGRPKWIVLVVRFLEQNLEKLQRMPKTREFKLLKIPFREIFLDIIRIHPKKEIPQILCYAFTKHNI